MQSRFSAMVSLSLAALGVMFGLALGTIGDIRGGPRLLTQTQALRIWGGQSGCDSRWYSIACNTMNSFGDPSGCSSGPCTGTCYWCLSGYNQNYCDYSGGAGENCIGCSLTATIFDCGTEYIGTCHLQDEICVCPGANDIPSGQRCPTYYTKSCPSGENCPGAP
jgi:hypothetical protein